jgi:hypothetical protein
MLNQRVIKFRDYDMESKQVRYFDLDSYDKHEHDSYGNITQFTGLQDREGNDIYEGDIVESYGGLELLVSFLDKNELYTIGFLLTHPNGFCAYLTPSSGDVLNIIGNIYENPELLK